MTAHPSREGEQLPVIQHPPVTSPAPAGDRTDQNLSDAVASVATEIGRTDNKASLLLAFNGAIVAGLAGAVSKQLPLLPRLAGAMATGTLTTSAVLLLLVVRPRLSAVDGSTDRSTFTHWAGCEPQQIRKEMSDDRRPDRIRILSQIALRKYLGLRRAIDLSLAAVAFLVLAVVAALIGR